MTKSSVKDYLYDKIRRVPPISDEQIAEMRHIIPVLRDEKTCMFRNIEGIEKIDPRNTSFLWDANPTGDEFTFDTLNTATIITQHNSGVFFKPSLAEIYSWMLVFVPDNWNVFTHFWITQPKRIAGSTDVACECNLMGGDLLVRGRDYLFANGEVGYTLAPLNRSHR